MTNCWKCKNPLRADQAAFCAVCGAAQKPDQDPAAARDWKSRLNDVERPPSWGLSFLWLIAWLIAPLTYPALMVRANRRLKRHVQQRLASPALASARFTQSDEGRLIAQRLATSAGRLGSGGNVGLAVLSYLIIAVMAGFVFITPAISPRSVRYEAAFEGIFEARPARTYVYIGSAAEYEQLWQGPVYKFSRVVVRTNSRLVQQSPRYLPTWDINGPDTPYLHRPYEYVRSEVNSSWRGTYRVDSAVLEWDGTLVATVVFYVGLGVLYVTYTIWGLVFWARFARHARAEAVAAAYAKDDVALHDRLVPGVETRNTMLMVGIVVVSILPPFAWHLVLFPILSAVMFARHYGFERRSGVAAALGVAA